MLVGNLSNEISFDSSNRSIQLFLDSKFRVGSSITRYFDRFQHATNILIHRKIVCERDSTVVLLLFFTSWSWCSRLYTSVRYIFLSDFLPYTFLCTLFFFISIIRNNSYITRTHTHTHTCAHQSSTTFGHTYTHNLHVQGGKNRLVHLSVPFSCATFAFSTRILIRPLSSFSFRSGILIFPATSGELPLPDFDTLFPVSDTFYSFVPLLHFTTVFDPRKNFPQVRVRTCSRWYERSKISPSFYLRYYLSISTSVFTSIWKIISFVISTRVKSFVIPKR